MPRQKTPPRVPKGASPLLPVHVPQTVQELRDLALDLGLWEPARIADLAEPNRKAIIRNYWRKAHSHLLRLRDLLWQGEVNRYDCSQLVRSYLEQVWCETNDLWWISGLRHAGPGEGDELPALSAHRRSLERWAELIEQAGSADKKTDSPLSPRQPIPESKELLRLARKLRDEQSKWRTKIDVAKEFTDGNERRANSLLRQLRRYPQLLA